MLLSLGNDRRSELEDEDCLARRGPLMEPSNPVMTKIRGHMLQIGPRYFKASGPSKAMEATKVISGMHHSLG